jgi:multidrug efflux pump subunit AcrA (membrane-fusion protein)
VKVPVAVDAKGVIATEHPRVPLVSQVSGKIKTLLTSEGKTVNAGSLLIVLDSEISAKDYEEIKSQAATLRNLIQLEKTDTCGLSCKKDFINLSGQAFTQKVPTSIRADISEARDTLAQWSNSKATREKSAPEILSRERRIRSLIDKRRLLKRNNNGGNLGFEIESLTTQIDQLQLEITNLKASASLGVQQARERLQIKLDAVLQRIEEFRTEREIRAPISGIVSNLKTSAVGQMLAAGDEVAQIIPTDSILIAEMVVANRDISEIKVGSETIIELEPYPKRRFGTIHGTVFEIPIESTGPRDSNKDVRLSDNFRVRIRLEKQFLERDGKLHQLLPGMNAKAKIIAREAPLQNILAEKIFSLEQDL